MPDPLTALAERLAKIPFANEWTGRRDYEEIAREALAFAREQLPTKREIAAIILEAVRADKPEADALLRALRARLGG